MRILKICAMFVAAMVAAGAAAAEKTFVLVDSALGMGARCYRLCDGWQAWGAINWNLQSDNKYFESVILYSPAKRMAVQTGGPMIKCSGALTPRLSLEFQNANVLAEDLAAEFNSGIVIPGLSPFTAKGGRFTQDVPDFTLRLAEAANTGTGLTRTWAFGFEGVYACTWNGVKCEARYATSYAVAISAVVNPRIPQICNFTRCGFTLVIAPEGELAAACAAGGRMLGGAFENRIWTKRRDGTLAALLQGTMQGREEGWRLWREAQANTARTLDKTRRMRSEQIREVELVANPVAPGEKIERSTRFDHSWIDSTGEFMISSDRNLEPSEVAKLAGAGEWMEMR